MAELITVPTFIFNQGDPWDENGGERPVHVDYYDNGELIELRQDGNYDEQEKILLRVRDIDKLFKEIKKHLPLATNKLIKG